MYLFATKFVPDNRDIAYFAGHHDVLEVHRWGVSWIRVGVDKKDGHWHELHSSDIGFDINKNFALGGEHVYYDGPHCFFSLGWIHFRWNNWNCKKCIAERDGDDE